MKATKQFKIGEWVVGGIIRVNITGEVIEIKFQDYNTKETIIIGSILSNTRDAQQQLINFLEVHGTAYYADKVMKWIKSKITFEHYLF